jgi:shikimate kinase
MTVLITVWGASPGVGKSTLCAGLSRWLVDEGLRVDHFREEEILTRPQFAAVAEEFKATRAVVLGTLLETTAEFVDSVLATGGDVVIADARSAFTWRDGNLTLAKMTQAPHRVRRVRPVELHPNSPPDAWTARQCDGRTDRHCLPSAL